MAVLNEEKGKQRDRVFTYKGRPLGQANTRSWRNALDKLHTRRFRYYSVSAGQGHCSWRKRAIDTRGNDQ